MNEENMIQEAQVEPAQVSELEKPNSCCAWRKKINSEIIMLAIIGVLFGMAIKTEVSKRVNIADKAVYGKQAYDLAKPQEETATEEAVPTDGAEPSEQPATPQQ